jgi:hypothetical protein
MAIWRTQPGLAIRSPFGVEYTVVVQGAFRGGTSLLVASVPVLRIPLGERVCCGDETEESEDLNIEDVAFQQLRHNTDLLVTAPSSSSATSGRWPRKSSRGDC